MSETVGPKYEVLPKNLGNLTIKKKFLTVSPSFHCLSFEVVLLGMCTAIPACLP